MFNAATQPVLALLGPIGTPELIVLAIVGLLIFGKKLPEVGKSVGKGIVEFKRGLQGIEEEIDDASKKKQDPQQLESSQPGDTVHQASETEQQQAGGSSAPSA